MRGANTKSLTFQPLANARSTRPFDSRDAGVELLGALLDVKILAEAQDIDA